MGLANRRLSYHMTASHPSVNTGTDQDHNHAGGLQAEKDKGVHNLQNEASKEEQETDWNDVDDDPHNENPCEEEAELVDSEVGSKTVSSVENRTCSTCFKIFYSKANMKAHVKKHHERESRFECVVCQSSFSAKISLEYHLRKVHSDSGKVSCERCDDKFPDFKTYVVHRKSHRTIHFQLEHKCDECNKIIRGKNNLKQHLKEVHSIDETHDLKKVTVLIFPHKCEECSEVFKRRNDLVNHVQGIHRGKRFSCNFCDKSFPYKRNLTRHIKNIHK
jgi:hypothetical protein